MIFDINNLKVNSKLYDSTCEFTPKYYRYIHDSSNEIGEKIRPTLIVCPGGGYYMTSDREAEPVASEFFAHGMNVYVLRYSVFPCRFPQALLELATLVKLVRDEANETKADINRIYVAGFSAGGHLAASLGVHWNAEFLKSALGFNDEHKPNGLILSYPVITSGKFSHRGSFEALLNNCENKEELENLLSLELQVSKDTPKTFLWHTFDDNAVPVENSLMFAMELRKNKVPCELHIFPSGVHGLSICNENSANNESQINPYCRSWVDHAIKFIDEI